MKSGLRVASFTLEVKRRNAYKYYLVVICVK